MLITYTSTLHFGPGLRRSIS